MYAHLEVGCEWGQDHSRTHRADILVTNWDCGTSAAFDITVASLLNSLNMLEACMYQDVCLKCVELGWQYIPLAVENCGAWGSGLFTAFSNHVNMGSPHSMYHVPNKTVFGVAMGTVHLLTHDDISNPSFIIQILIQYTSISYVWAVWLTLRHYINPCLPNNHNGRCIVAEDIGMTACVH